MTPKALLKLALSDLDDLKAVNVSPLDVSSITPIADYIIIATGNSSRHIHALRENLIRRMKARDVIPSGVEGDNDEEWVLVDLGDVVIHLMQPRVRDFYNLEKLWMHEAQPEAAIA